MHWYFMWIWVDQLYYFTYFCFSLHLYLFLTRWNLYCQIIMRLPDDAEVSDELWDEVIDCIKVRVGDKVPVIRTYSVRALSRFANDAENSDILELLLETLPSEQNHVSFVCPSFYIPLLSFFHLLITLLFPTYSIYTGCSQNHTSILTSF